MKFTITRMEGPGQLSIAGIPLPVGETREIEVTDGSWPIMVIEPAGTLDLGPTPTDHIQEPAGTDEQ